MTDADKAPKKRGRPPRNPADGAKPTFNFRLRSALRERLEREAALSARSVSEEIERRLDLSFRDYDHLSMLAAGNKNADFIFACMTALRFIDARYNGDWTENDDLRNLVAYTVGYIAASLGPLSRVAVPQLRDVSEEIRDKARIISGKAIALNVRGEDPLDDVRSLESGEMDGGKYLV